MSQNSQNQQDIHSEALEAANKLLKELKDKNEINNNKVYHYSGDIRYFKLYNLETHEAYGRFSGIKPKQAASKALSHLLQQGLQSPMTFYLKECTRGSKFKVYKYIGERVELKEPMKLKIGSGADTKEITYSFRNKVIKIK